MRIAWIIIDENADEHIQRHGVMPEEVRQLAGSNPLIRRGRGPSRRRPTYYLYGRTSEGRSLFAAVRALGKGAARLVTARPMDDSERRLLLRSRR